MRRLSEAVGITPAERERAALPNYIQGILPIAQALAVASSAPITVHQEDWEFCEKPRCLRRTFRCVSKSQVKAFILEVLGLEEEMQHSSVIKIADCTVTIAVSTHTLQDVTQRDIEFADEVTQIFKDIGFYAR